MHKLLIIIPAYNEAENLNLVVSQIPKNIPGIDHFETVVIDDGSQDDTQKICRALNLRVISHPRNLGVGAAFKTGVEFALSHAATIMVNIDADNQFSPLEIPRLIAPIIHESADFVSGNRFSHGRPKNMPAIKYFGNLFMATFVGKLVKNKFSDVSCGFRAYNREALLQLNLFSTFTYTQETFLDLSFKNLRITQVPVSVTYDPLRRSRVANNLWAFGFKTIGIIARSYVNYEPFKFFGYPGLLLVVTGVFFVLFLLVHKFISGTYTPYKAYGFIGASAAIFGLLMVILGLASDILKKIRLTQEKNLYLSKKIFYRD